MDTIQPKISIKNTRFASAAHVLWHSGFLLIESPAMPAP
jgi:hypothetical protein